MGAEKVEKRRKKSQQVAALEDGSDAITAKLAVTLDAAEPARKKKQKRKLAEVADAASASPVLAEASVSEPAKKKAKRAKASAVEGASDLPTNPAAELAEPVEPKKKNKKKLKAAEDAEAPKTTSAPEAAQPGSGSRKKSKKAKAAPAEAALANGLVAPEITAHTPQGSKTTVRPEKAAGVALPSAALLVAAETGVAASDSGAVKKKKGKTSTAPAELQSSLLAEGAGADQSALTDSHGPGKSDKTAKKKSKRSGAQLVAPEAAAASEPALHDKQPSAQEPGKKAKKKRQAEASEAAAGTAASAANGQTATDNPAADPLQQGEAKRSSKKKKKAAAAEAAAPEPAPAEEAAASGSQPEGADDRAEERLTGGSNKKSASRSERGGPQRAFQRVRAEEWLDKKGAWDNSYQATFGDGGWGAGAQAILGQVRGKDFRHEKTKKKRGSYRGGLIDHAVNSFKFESDDE